MGASAAWRIVLRLVLGALQIWLAVIAAISWLGGMPRPVAIGVTVAAVLAFLTSRCLSRLGVWAVPNTVR